MTDLSHSRFKLKGHWFSENKSKAWGEKFFLIYSPIWIALTTLLVITGIGKNTGDIVNLIQAVIIMAPLFVVPLIIRKETDLGRKWYQTYWFKANLFISIFSLLGNYFGSEYFFDVLGMVYNYPNNMLNFDSVLVGSGQQKVPVMMYFLTCAYFMTYHTTAIVVIRRVKTMGIPGGKILFTVLVVVIGYFWAWIETFAMANPLMRESFYYKNMDRMLVFGSLIYASFFIVSFPIFYFIDEKKNDNWGILKTVGAALSASMLTFFMLDLWTRFIGSI
jgi:cycloeucalenol cycloisomerase